MRNLTKFFIVSCLGVGGFFAYSKGYTKWRGWRSQAPVFKTALPSRRTICRKKAFRGYLMPHKEVTIESQVTGIIEQLSVQVGDAVQAGSVLARVRVQPSIQEIVQAEHNLRSAAILRDQERSAFLRQQQLFRKKMIAKEKYEAALSKWETAKENFSNAQKALQITQLGYTKEKGIAASFVKATTKGVILDLPVKEGGMVQCKVAQSSGTKVAIIGDMDRLLFTAQVSELDVFYLKEGMSFEIRLNACDTVKLKVILTKIAPKADSKMLEKDEVKFYIEGVVERPKNFKILLRAGYVALADIVIDKADNVLAVQESIIQTEGDDYFVPCLEQGKVVRKKVQLGISDGLYVAIKEGLTAQDHLIVE